MVKQLSAQHVQTLIRQGVPQAEELDLRVVEIGADYAIACVPFQAKAVRPGGTVSGPTQMALADAAMYALVLGALGAGQMAVTSQLNINFLQKPLAADLLAKAKLLRLGSKQAVCQVELYSQGAPETCVAFVTGTYSLN